MKSQGAHQAHALQTNINNTPFENQHGEIIDPRIGVSCLLRNCNVWAFTSLNLLARQCVAVFSWNVFWIWLAKQANKTQQLQIAQEIYSYLMLNASLISSLLLGFMA